MNKTTAPSSPSLFDTPRPGSNLPEYSVGDLSRRLKKTVEETFGLVRVRGEISDCKVHSSGHVYMTLKDETAVLSVVCWRGQVGKLAVKPAVGMEVVCTGHLTTYPGQSKYQMVVEGMALAGIGALLKMLEERKKKLAAEGLFDESRKRALPFLPEVIGVVTSPTGAVIRDILHRLADRFPRRVLLWPVAVQGEVAAGQIAAAITGFNAMPATSNAAGLRRPDILIVARGGGSVEDLMPFNEEVVVRAAAASGIPIISAVGHETDTTLIDFAADRRAPTPTAAAEIAVPVRADLLQQLAGMDARAQQSMRRMLVERRERIHLLSRALGDPARALEPLAQRLDERADRLQNALLVFMDRRRGLLREYAGRLRHPRDVVQVAAQRLVGLMTRQQAAMRDVLHKHQIRFEKMDVSLRHLSPRAVLGRGYALVQNASGQVVTAAQQISKGDVLSVEFYDGKKQVRADD